MSNIQSKIIADSLGPNKDRLTTFVVTFPRIILAEFNTHRMFSRNSASSRAIPFEKMVKSVEENPFIPIAWQKDHKGMQGTEYLEGGLQELYWLVSRDDAVKSAKLLNSIGVTKQLCNRLLEPFMYHTVIITSGKEGLDNFFELRCPQYEGMGKLFKSKKDFINYHNSDTLDWTNAIPNDQWKYLNKSQAEIHIQALAEAMWDSYNESTPKQLKAGEWHIPFGDDINRSKIIELINNKKPQGNMSIHQLTSLKEIEDIYIKIATARCARVSYTVVGEEGKEPNYENDIKLHDRLLASRHMSPAEHCCQSTNNSNYYYNIKGFKSYRWLIEQKKLNV